MDEPQAYTNSQDSPWPRLEGSHHLVPYSIFCAWLWACTQNVILFRDSQIESPKNLEIRTPVTLEAQNFLYKPSIEVKSKAKL